MGLGKGLKDNLVSQCVVYASDLKLDTESVQAAKARESELQIELASKMKIEA